MNPIKKPELKVIKEALLDPVKGTLTINYASKLYSIVLKEQEKLDELIEKKLVNWEMSRLATMDRIILRMSIGEMLFVDDIPPKVSITEAVEIAKEYSSKDSSGFINGIMDAIYNEHCIAK